MSFRPLRFLTTCSGARSRRPAAPARRAPAAVAAAEPLESRRLLAVTLVSVNPGGATATGGASSDSDLSADGRLVVFTSAATDLVADDTNDVADVFVRDTRDGATRLVSVPTTGGLANGAAGDASISADGRFVVFTTTATNMGALDTGPLPDVYVRDLEADTTTLVSVNAAGDAGTGTAAAPVISADGRYVAFSSAATTLTAGGDANGDVRDVFRRDLQENTTTLVSVNAAGNAGSGASDNPAISDDGQRVAFASTATNLTTDTPDANAGLDVFVRDFAGDGTTTLVSADAASGEVVDISGDGNVVAFSSVADDLVGGDANGVADVFVRDLTATTDAVTRVSVAGADNAEPNGASTNPSISRDGRYVAFESAATNLTGDGGDDAPDVFLRDRQENTTTRLSDTDDGDAQANGDSTDPSISADATRVSFTSLATNLVPVGSVADTNTFGDVFVATTGVDQGTPDATAPTATLAATQPAVTAGATTYDFTVNYADETALDISTLGDDDFVVVAPGTDGATIPATLVSSTPATGDTSAAAVYRIAAPGGTFDAADSGLYAVRVQSGAVRDAAGNAVAPDEIGLLNLTVDGGTTGPGPDLTATIDSTTPALPAAVIGGARGSAKVRVTNSGDANVAGPVTVGLFASTDATLGDAAAPVTTVRRNLRLRPGQSKVLGARFLYPALPDSAYFLLAQVDPLGAIEEGNETNNVTATAAAVTIAAPFVDLSATLGTPRSGAFLSGRRATVPVTLTNAGNLTLRASVTVDLFASTDNALDTTDAPLTSVTRRLSLRPGASRTVGLKFAFPTTVPPGSYFVAARVDPANTIVESNETNNEVVSDTAFLVSGTTL